MKFRTKRTKVKPVHNRSDLYFEAFVAAIKNTLGRLYFKDGEPVLITNIVVTDTYIKRVDIQYLLNSKTEECTVDTVDEFHKNFLTKKEYERRQSALEAMGFNEETE